MSVPNASSDTIAMVAFVASLIAIVLLGRANRLAGLGIRPLLLAVGVLVLLQGPLGTIRFGTDLVEFVARWAEATLWTADGSKAPMPAPRPPNRRAKR